MRVSRAPSSLGRSVPVDLDGGLRQGHLRFVREQEQPRDRGPIVNDQPLLAKPGRGFGLRDHLNQEIDDGERVGDVLEGRSNRLVLLLDQALGASKQTKTIVIVDRQALPRRVRHVIPASRLPSEGRGSSAPSPGASFQESRRRRGTRTRDRRCTGNAHLQQARMCPLASSVRPKPRQRNEPGLGSSKIRSPTRRHQRSQTPAQRLRQLRGADLDRLVVDEMALGASQQVTCLVAGGLSAHPSNTLQGT